MKLASLTKIIANFFAIVFLVGIMLIPLIFANNIAKVAGVKSESKYLIVSQIEKFPNLTLNQTGETYKITYEKFAKSQAFLSVLILNNPTSSSQTYQITSSSKEKAFFGENLENMLTEIQVPSNSSVPISLFVENSASGGLVDVSIKIN